MILMPKAKMLQVDVAALCAGIEKRIARSEQQDPWRDDPDKYLKVPCPDVESYGSDATYTVVVLMGGFVGVAKRNPHDKLLASRGLMLAMQRAVDAYLTTIPVPILRYRTAVTAATAATKA